MSINQSYAFDQKKAKRYGKYYGSIDFQCNPDITAKSFKNDLRNIEAGSFEISGRQYKLTWAEMTRIIETLKDAQEVLVKSYRYGNYN
jgi:hypothetical protein